MPPKPPAQRTKLIIRNLPPSLAEDAALDTLHTTISPTSYDFVAFVPGKVSNNAVRPARLYINLCNPGDVTRVASALHNKLFVSQRGAQFRVSVEFAPNQRVPRQSKPDKRSGTLETDADYMAFCEQLAAEPRPSDAAATAADATQSTSGAPVITPLMQALIAKHTPAPKPSAKNKRAGGSKAATNGARVATSSTASSSKLTAPAKVAAGRSHTIDSGNLQGKGQQGKAQGKAQGQTQGQARGQQGNQKGNQPQSSRAPPAANQSTPKVVVVMRQPPREAVPLNDGKAPESCAAQPQTSTTASRGSRSGSKASTSRAPAPSEESQRGQQRVREGFQVYRPKLRKGAG